MSKARNWLLERAQRKVEKAIDALVDIQDMGLGTGEIQHLLDTLNGIRFDV